MDRRIFNANQWAQQERNQLSGMLTLKSVHTKVRALEKKKIFLRKKKPKCVKIRLSNPLQYLTHVLKSKYCHLDGSTHQRISNKFRNNHKHTLQSPTWPHYTELAVGLWTGSVWACITLGALRQRSITVTSVGLYFMAGLGRWVARWWRRAGVWDVTAQDLVCATPRGYQACNERILLIFRYMSCVV